MSRHRSRDEGDVVSDPSSESCVPPNDRQKSEHHCEASSPTFRPLVRIHSIPSPLRKRRRNQSQSSSGKEEEDVVSPSQGEIFFGNQVD